MDRRAGRVIDGDEFRLIEVNHLLERLDDLENEVAVSRCQLRQENVLGRIGSRERRWTGPVPQASHAAEVRYEREILTVPGEEVRA